MGPTKRRHKPHNPHKTTRTLFTGGELGDAARPYCVDADCARIAVSESRDIVVNIKSGSFELLRLLPILAVERGASVYFTSSVNKQQFNRLPERLRAVVTSGKVAIHRLICGNTQPVFSATGEPYDVHHVNHCTADMTDGNLNALPKSQHGRYDRGQPVGLGQRPAELSSRVEAWLAAGGSFHAANAKTERHATAAARQHERSRKQNEEKITTEYIWRWFRNEYLDPYNEDKHIAYKAGTLYDGRSYTDFANAIEKRCGFRPTARLVARCIRNLFNLSTVARSTGRTTRNVYVFTSTVKPCSPLPPYLQESNIGTEARDWIQPPFPYAGDGSLAAQIAAVRAGESKAEWQKYYLSTEERHERDAALAAAEELPAPDRAALMTAAVMAHAGELGDQLDRVLVELVNRDLLTAMMFVGVDRSTRSAVLRSVAETRQSNAQSNDTQAQPEHELTQASSASVSVSE